MTRDEIISHFAAHEKEFKKYAKNIAGTQDYEDLFQECALMLCEMPEEKLQSYWNKDEGLKPFILRMLQLQYNSKTSKYHKVYRKEAEKIKKHKDAIIYESPNAISYVWNDEPEEVVDPSIANKARQFVHIGLGELFPCEEKENVFDLYVQTGSLRKTLAAIPEEKQNLFDLKTVHEIVRTYRRAIKMNIKKLQAA